MRSGRWAAAVGLCLLLAPGARAEAAQEPFSTPVTISPADSNYPALAMNARGDLVVGYTNVYDTAPRVEAVTQPAGAAFRAPASLPASAFDFPLAVGIDPDGLASVLWRQAPTGTASGQVWVASGPVEAGPATPQAIGEMPPGQLFADRHGNALALWTDPDAPGRLWAAWRPAGQSFGAAQLLSRDAYGDRSATFEADGRPLVVFAAVDPGHGPGDVQRLYVMSAGPDGRFAAPVPLSQPGVDVRSNVPRVAVSPRGDAIVTWLGNTSGAPAGFAPGMGTVQAAVRPPGGDFGPPIDVAQRGAFATNVAMDATGDALILWQGPPGEQATFRRRDGTLVGPRAIPDACPCTAQDAVGFDPHGNAVVVLTYPTSGRDPVTHRAMPHKVLATARRADGTWTATQTLFVGYAYHGPTLFLSDLAFDAFGRGAVAFGTNYDGRIRVAAYDSARLAHATAVVSALRLARRTLSVRYRLSRPALTRIQLERLPLARSSRRRPRTVRTRLVKGRPGVNRVRLGGPRVAPGRYRLTVRPLDIAGHPLTTRRLRVRLSR
jgi:hypothetical protein